MDKLAKLLNQANLALAQLFEEIGKEKARTGLDEGTLLESAAKQAGLNEEQIKAMIERYRTEIAGGSGS